MGNVDLYDLGLRLLLGQVPLLAVALVGLGYVVVNRHRLGQARPWAIWGFSLLTASAIAMVVLVCVFAVWRADPAATTGADATRFGIIRSLSNLPVLLVFIAGLAAVARGVFVDRGSVAR